MIHIKSLCFIATIFSAAVVLLAGSIRADETLHRYEGDVIPQDPSAGWQISQPCVGSCRELLEGGHFVLEWSDGFPFVNYQRLINISPEPPISLWVEWRYRSNQPKPRFKNFCDGVFQIFYGGISEWIQLFADTALTPFGQGFVTNLSIEEFHLYRFETVDGVNYRVSVDGNVFVDNSESNVPEFFGLVFGGDGSCDAALFPTRNEWDFIRYGTVSFGEQIVTTDPPSGFVSPLQYPNLDRFHVTFNAANYVYVDDITVISTALTVPTVLETRRRENDEPNMVEIVLDQPIPLGKTTTFTIEDGIASNVISYTYGCPNPVDNVDTDGDTVLNCNDQCPGQDDTIDLNENSAPDCAEAIPTISHWGLVVLTLLLLTLAKCAKHSKTIA